MSSAGKWNYSGITAPFPYGSSETYELGAQFLHGLAIEDWGCGGGWMRQFHKGPYIGIDGSLSPFADVVIDLRAVVTVTPGLFMRHVLEHNYAWRDILRNAVASFQRRMVLVIFTPLEAATRVMRSGVASAPGNPDVPDIAFCRKDLVDLFDDAVIVNEGRVETKTQYGAEYIFYLSKEET